MKFLKNNIFLLALLGVMFSCDPLEETYDELDAIGAGTSGEFNFEYTISEDNYSSFSDASDNDSLIADNGYFADFDQAERLIPDILADEFPQVGGNSSIRVFFEVDEGLREIASLVNAIELEIGAEEYTGIDVSLEAAGFMSPSYDTEEVIIEVLENEIQSPGEGDVYAVEFGYASVDPIVDFESAGLKVLHQELFSDDIDGYTAQNVSGDQVFVYNSFFDGNAYMSGFASGSAQPNEDWIVSPMIDLTDLTDAELRFHQVINFLGDGNDPAEVLRVKVSTDYSGDVTTATWTQLTVDAWPAGNSWSEEVWSTMDISTFDGQQIYVAFEYNTTVNVISPAWEIGEVIVEAVAEVSVETVAEPIDLIEYFTVVGGEWEKVEGVYALNEVDYDGMGEASGQPGRFNNFSSSVNPDNYLPIFLSRTFPYAQEDDKLIVTYKFFNGSTVTRGDVYTFSDGTWSDEKVNLSFGFDGDVWVPDNTIKYTLGFADYQFIGEAYATSNAEGSESMLTYTNFELELWSEDQIFEAITNLLLDLYPETEEGQKYLVTYDTWMPGSGTGELYVIFEGGEYIVYDPLAN